MTEQYNKVKTFISGVYDSFKVPVRASGRGKCVATCTSNNTHIVISQRIGKGTMRKMKKIHRSTGLIGFKGTKRGSPQSAEIVAREIGKLAKNNGLKTLDVVRVGFGRGRNRILKGLITSGMKISSISDGTPFPHGGCRPKKIRRV